ncbi:Bpu10I family restriction endonuclease [Sinorhizobium meliloti]|uniref:Bpu10I family restriction endonuclease n=1 Tax=Rhizobium meliloti TaxID=382 RepID=UPI003D64D1DA
MTDVLKMPTHGDKLRALLVNNKLPANDVGRVTETVKIYEAWIKELRNPVGDTPSQILDSLVNSLNAYKRHIELELIFDAEDDFLYRQKGQLKLDNTILEEFLPYLFDHRLVPGLARIPNLSAGPQSSFAGLSFASPFMALNAGGVYLKLKDQDFSVTKSHRITIADEPSNGKSFETKFYVSHFATEIKTNLDKTMFQEASQTAAELKRAVPGSTYILLCEFLDMTPITTKLTSIDEVIVLRKAKRLGSNVREKFSTAAGRKACREQYLKFLDANPLQLDCFARFVAHLNECFPEKEEDAEDVVLGRGYF